jgi:signal transduction histidine kinase
MCAGSPAIVGNWRGSARLSGDAKTHPGAFTTASWTLDASAARPLIASVANGTGPPDWADALLARIVVVDVDERLARLIGPYADRDQMIGRPIGDYWPRESRQAVAELVLGAASGETPDAGRSRPATSLMFADFTVGVACDETAAQPDRMILTVRGRIVDDRSFWSVRASEERYRNLIHHLPVALLQVDAREIGDVYEGLRRGGVADLVAYARDHPELIDAANDSVRVTEANANAVRLFGAADMAELIGPVGYLFAASRDSALRVMDARFKGRRSHAEVMKMRTLDGRLLDIAITVTYPRPPERLDVTLISLEDITERLRTEVQLRQLQADYSRAARISMLGELATSIAHEVNQPLSAIVTNAETSLRWLSRADPNLAKVGQLTARIATSARLASDIVQRIRAMAAPRAPERVLVDLNGIVEEALIFVRHEVETRSIELSVRLDPGLPAVHGDRVQLQQVIVNLLINAVQALGQREGGRIELCTASGADGTIRFAIHDDGPGIAPENLDRIFGSFFTTRADGMGIGLAICQSIIAAHNGAIEASNHADGGAQFRFSLPAVEG